jgi:hypothetical protein
MGSYIVIYTLSAIGFTSVIYLFIYAWRHPPEQEIRQKTDDKQIDLKELQQKYDVIVSEISEVKNIVTELRNQLSKNGLIR